MLQEKINKKNNSLPSYEVPGSKPKRLKKSQRPNNPSLASYSMKALFGQEKLDILDNKFYQYRNSPLPFSYNNYNPQSINKRNNQQQQKTIFSKQLIKNQSQNNKISFNNLTNLRSQSLPKIIPENSTRDIYQEVIDQAKIQFNQRKQINHLGNSSRNSMNQLLYKKGIQLNQNNLHKQEDKINDLSDPRRNNSIALSQFNFLNHNSIRNKQKHGYNIINCIPGSYM